MTEDANSSGGPQSTRRSSRLDEGSRPSSRSRDGRVENFRQKHAATSIQRQWRQRKQHQRYDDEVRIYQLSLLVNSLGEIY